MIRDHLRHNSGSDEDVFEILQETVIIIYRQITTDRFTLTSDLKGYFFGIARNLWNTQLRYRSRLVPLDEGHSSIATVEEQSRALLERIVARSFELLGSDCREVLKLFGEGLPYEEIALRMGFRNEGYARRKKYLCKEALIVIIKSDTEYHDLGPL